jgi:Tfp pilus assembly protein PilF
MVGCADVITYANRSREEGLRLHRQDAHADAAGAFRNAIRQDPRDYRSHYYLGVCYDKLGEHQQAFAQYRTALDVIRHTMEGRIDEEFRLIILDTYAQSIATYDIREVELTAAEDRARSGQNAEAWFLLGKIYRLKGDADSSLTAYRNAARWDVENFHIRKDVGLYLLEPLNNRDESAYFLRQAYHLNPNDDAVNAALAKLGINPTPARPEKLPPQRVTATPKD